MASCNKKTLQTNFHSFYTYLCSKLNIIPLPEIKYHADNNCLDFYVDRILFDNWHPILNALSHDKTLHFIAIRTRHSGKHVLEKVDSESKARVVMTRPVIFTKFMMDLMTNALVNCLSASPCLASIELEGLPLNLNYVSLLSNAFKKCPSLQNISFHGSSIGDEGCKNVTQNIKNLLNIISLDFTSCGITEKGARYVADLIEYQRVQRLSELWKQSLRHQQANVDCMSGLRRITLNGNIKIGRNGIIYILEILFNDFWVKAIDLQNCGADEEVASYILKLLDVNKILSVVDLRDNEEISNNSLAYIMEKLSYNNNKGVKFNWISVQKSFLTKNLLSEKETSTVDRAACRMRPKSAIVKPTSRNVSSDVLARRKSETDVNKSSNQRIDNFTNGRPINNARLKELLKPIGKLCMRREDITPGIPRSLQQQEKVHCVVRPPPPPAAPPPTPELCSLHNMSSNIEEYIQQMSQEEMVCIVKEMTKERKETLQEIARLTAENKKLQADLDKYHEEIEQIQVNTNGKVLVDETVMANLQSIVKKVFETKNSKRFVEDIPTDEETGIQNEDFQEENMNFQNLITKKSFSLPCNDYKLPFSKRSLKYASGFDNTYLNGPMCGNTAEYVTVSCNKEYSNITEAKYSMLHCLTKELTQIKVGDVSENISYYCDITKGNEDQQLFELQSNNFKSKLRELIQSESYSSVNSSPSGSRPATDITKNEDSDNCSYLSSLSG